MPALHSSFYKPDALCATLQKMMKLGSFKYVLRDLEISKMTLRNFGPQAFVRKNISYQHHYRQTDTTETIYAPLKSLGEHYNKILLIYFELNSSLRISIICIIYIKKTLTAKKKKFHSKLHFVSFLWCP
jgi:hypothetical protein